MSSFVLQQHDRPQFTMQGRTVEADVAGQKVFNAKEAIRAAFVLFGVTLPDQFDLYGGHLPLHETDSIANLQYEIR
jgi:hypothetical protein